MQWFMNLFACQVVVVDETGAVKDPDTGQVFPDLTADYMADSDDWAEYPGDPRIE